MRLDVPVDPDANTAREWAREELAKHEYQGGTGTNWLQRFFDWISNLISSLGNGFGGAWGGWGFVVAVIVVAGVIVLAVWLLVGPLRRSRGRGGDDEELGDPTLSADQLRENAQAAARAGDWNAAVIDAYRALIRSLAQRDAIDAPPGMTAFEAALAASASMPAIASGVTADADVFDAVRYGHLAATREHYDHVLATTAAAGKARVEVPA
jgi:hypothetical protein